MAEDEPQAPRNLSLQRRDKMLSRFANFGTARLEFPAFPLFAIKSVYGVRTNKRSTDLVGRLPNSSVSSTFNDNLIMRRPAC